MKINQLEPRVILDVIKKCLIKKSFKIVKTLQNQFCYFGACFWILWLLVFTTNFWPGSIFCIWISELVVLSKVMKFHLYSFRKCYFVQEILVSFIRVQLLFTTKGSIHLLQFYCVLLGRAQVQKHCAISELNCVFFLLSRRRRFEKALPFIRKQILDALKYL